MLNRSIPVGVAGLVSLALAGCGGGGGSDTQATPQGVMGDITSPRVTITGTELMSNGAQGRVRGTATDDVGVAEITWTTDRGASGSVAMFGNERTSVQWTTFPNVALQPGENRVTFNVVDATGNATQTMVMLIR